MFKISPSDLSFSWEGCRNCFYLKTIHGISQPSIPIPAIFTKIAGLLKNYSNSMDTKDLHSDLPRGRVAFGEKSIQSKPIYSTDGQSACYIKGRFDIVVSFDDGSFGILDFKTSAHGSHSDIYGRQLHAYAYALENPADGALSLSPISYLGLIYYQPNAVNSAGNFAINFLAEAKLIEIKKDEASFMKFMQEVLSVLVGPMPAPQVCKTCDYCKIGKNCPKFNERAEKGCTCCDWCNYRASFGGTTLQQKTSEPCPICGGPISLKTGRFGPFLSCTKYPDCKGTRNTEEN